jgi:predicted transcriptional regulator of viral defense system
MIKLDKIEKQEQRLWYIQQAIENGKVLIEFIAKKQLLRTPVQAIKTVAGYIKVSTPESTAMDIVCYVRKCGGLNSVLTILEELAERMETESLKALADAGHEKYWIQRLGFLLEELGCLELSETLYGIKN